MKLYNSVGPNPLVVRMFVAEKGLDIPKVAVDLRGGENRQPDYLTKNPHGQLPCLELDDGQCISEIVAICEYLEDVHPAPPLIGTTAEEKAETRMWTRRIDLNIAHPISGGFQFGEGLPIFEGRILTVPEMSPGFKAIARDRLGWLDTQMADGREFVCGNRFTLADILLYGFLHFGNRVGQPLAPELAHVSAWFARVKARPSADA